MHSTAQHSTAQHSTAQHSTAQHSTAQHSTAQHSTQRIEYLDALRGFTMLLVVMTHISGFSFHTGESFNHYMAQFRMPLFFFVSGFVFYKNNFSWNASNTISFLKKKIPVQLITPLIFLLCYIHIKDIPAEHAFATDHKVGYWFTFTLFEFFAIYILLQKIFDLLHIKEKWRFTVLAIVGISLYNNFPINCLFHMGFTARELNLACLTKLQYFIFFITGAFAKRHFSQFEQLLDSKPFIPSVIAIYFLTNIFIDIKALNHHIQNNLSLLLGLCGIAIIFSLFRKNKAIFAGKSKMSETMKFIGKRTLDIYLIHYFFIPFDLYKAFPLFAEMQMPIIEITATLVLATLIVIACLAVSSVLRINNTLAHYLFGAKK